VAQDVALAGGVDTRIDRRVPEHGLGHLTSAQIEVEAAAGAHYPVFHTPGKADAGLQVVPVALDCRFGNTVHPALHDSCTFERPIDSAVAFRPEIDHIDVVRRGLLVG